MHYQNVCLEALAYELPPNVVSTEAMVEELEPTLARLGIPPSTLVALTGVEERRMWDPGTEIAPMAARAGRRALEASGLKAEDMGCLISTSVSKDYIEPSVAAMVHGDLGLPSTCMNFDVGNACLAFLNGLALVADQIERGEIRAGIVVDCESSREVTEATIRRLLQPGTTPESFRQQFATLTLGSGAVAAVLVHRSLSKAGHRITGHVSLADTRFSRMCLGRPTEMVTDLKRLMSAGIELATTTWRLACRTFGWTAQNVDLFICHQVGSTHHHTLFQKLGLDVDRSFLTFPFLGNVGPASVPLTLALARDRGCLRPGSRAALMGIGSGLNCSMMEVLW